MALNTYTKFTITNSGLTYQFIPSTLPDVVYLVLSANLTLANDVNIYTGVDSPMMGTSVIYYITGTPNVDLNGHLFQIEGSSIDEDTLRSGCFVYLVSDGTDWSVPFISPTLDPSNPLPNFNGKYIVDGTVLFSALESLNRGSIIVGNSSNVADTLDATGDGKILIGDGTDLNSVSVTGDVTITNAGVTSISSGVIVNADINASAAIARTKIASGTADYVLINSGAGVMSQEAQLATSRGGTAINTSSSTGFATVSSGTWSVAALTDVRHVDNLSFVTANQGTYYVYFPFACTVTNINVRVTSVIAGTDAGSLTIQNNAGTAMVGSSLTAGVLTVAPGAAFGTGYSSTLTSNNTFTAGQNMLLITSKTTSGGVVSADITYTRTV